MTFEGPKYSCHQEGRRSSIVGSITARKETSAQAFERKKKAEMR
jgi:hypothetical protein